MRSQEAQLRIAQQGARRRRGARAVRRRRRDAQRATRARRSASTARSSRSSTSARMEIEAPAPASEIPSVKVGPGRDLHASTASASASSRAASSASTHGAAGLALDRALYLGGQPRRRAARRHVRQGPDRARPPAAGGRRARRPRSARSPARPTSSRSRTARSRAAPVKVGTVQQAEGVVEVLSGLEQGMNVVAARVSGLKAGAPARLKAAEATPAQGGLRSRPCGSPAPASTSRCSPPWSWWRSACSASSRTTGCASSACPTSPSRSPSSRSSTRARRPRRSRTTSTSRSRRSSTPSTA